jgi:hypothetical protein
VLLLQVAEFDAHARERRVGLVEHAAARVHGHADGFHQILRPRCRVHPRVERRAVRVPERPRPQRPGARQRLGGGAQFDSFESARARGGAQRVEIGAAGETGERLGARGGLRLASALGAGARLVRRRQVGARGEADAASGRRRGAFGEQRERRAPAERCERLVGEGRHGIGGHERGAPAA